LLRSGAGGYVLKSASPEEPLRAIRAVGAGGTFIDPAIAKHVAPAAMGKATEAELSERERVVLQCLAHRLKGSAPQKDLPPAQRTELLDTARAGVARGVALVRRLETISGTTVGEHLPVEIDAVVEEVVSILKLKASSGVHFEAENANDLWPVLGDVTQLTEAVRHLEENARDLPEQNTPRKRYRDEHESISLITRVITWDF
jgi:nitrogen-specific signal transduction histidine kinase